ncbi:MAG: hypothetical protein IKM97_02840 [Clostridia bacterium]|nr:hypothetical protein [Clostridia bacterium]
MFHKMKADLIIAEKKWSNEYKKSEYFSRKDPQGFLIFEKGAIQIGSAGRRRIFFSDTLSNDMVERICSPLGIEVSRYSLKPLHAPNRPPFIHGLWEDFANNGGQGRGYGIPQDERER